MIRREKDESVTSGILRNRLDQPIELGGTLEPSLHFVRVQVRLDHQEIALLVTRKNADGELCRGLNSKTRSIRQHTRAFAIGRDRIKRVAEVVSLLRQFRRKIYSDLRR